METDLALRRQLLRLVLRDTLKFNHVPPQWIGGEINALQAQDGEVTVEVLLVMQCDEPRLLTYLTTFQADFQQRLLQIEPGARKWVSGISWRLHPDPNFGLTMPTAEYWAHVQRDRDVTARQKGILDWDPDMLARHFEDTDPGELVDFEETRPPERSVENVAHPELD